MDVFDIIGPVMVGPSSSHTAGAAKLGKIARMALDDIPVRCKILLHGSFSRTYREHGTDKALVGGVLGFNPDDPRIRDSMTLAQAAGIEFEFEPADLGDVHPNTALIQLTGRSGRTITVLGSSIGGSNVVIKRINELDVEFTGEYFTLIIPHKDAPGVVAAVTGLLSLSSINIAQMKVYRTNRGGNAMILIETDQEIGKDLVERIEALPRVSGVSVIKPI